MSDSEPETPLEERIHQLVAQQEATTEAVAAQAALLQRLIQMMEVQGAAVQQSNQSAPLQSTEGSGQAGAANRQPPPLVRTGAAGTISTATGTSLNISLPTPKLTEFSGESEESITRWARMARGTLAHYGDEPVRVALAAQALRGNAQTWYATEVEKGLRPESLDQLLERLTTRYQGAFPEEKALRELESWCQQDKEGAEAYYLRLLEATVDLPRFTDAPLLQYYLRGLRQDWRAQLDADVRVTRISNPKYTLTLERAREVVASIEYGGKSGHHEESAEDMTVVNAARWTQHAWVDKEEYERRRKAGLCGRCETPWMHGHTCSPSSAEAEAQ